MISDATNSAILKRVIMAFVAVAMTAVLAACGGGGGVSPAAAISAQPTDQSAVAGTAATFSVTATNATDYQWQRSSAGSTFVDVAGATSVSHKTGVTTLADSGAQYRVVVSGGGGTVTSSAATLTVTAAAVAPSITTQPTSVTITAGQNAQFTVAASGLPTPTLQWQMSTDNGASFSNITGATSAVFEVLSAAQGNTGRQFRAVASNSAGSVNSGAATLTVNAAPVASLYEGFSYPTGETLDGKSGGLGWDGAWVLTSGDAYLPAASSGYIVTGLGYTDAAGNALAVNGGAWQTDAAVPFGQARRASLNTEGAAGTTRWTSFLVKQAPTTIGTNYATVSPGTGYGAGSPALAGGINGSSASVNCFYCTTAGSAAPITGWVAGSVAMVLTKVDFAASGNDTMSLWINPPLTGPLPAPMLVGSQANFADALSGLTLAWGDGRSFIFDELRMGEARDAVSSFTPPSTVGTAVFSVDFESPVPSQVTVAGALVAGVQGYAGLGPTGNTFAGSFLRSETGNTVAISLTDLPVHHWLTLDFLFAAIDSLDGTGSFPAGDYFRITVDGVDFFRESFANALASQIQSYVPPPGVQLARRVDLGFTPGGPQSNYSDSAYWMGGDPIFQRIPHSASSVTITLRLEGTPQGLADESWAIDNLRVFVGP